MSSDPTHARRAFVRRPQFSLESNYGPVLDLSAGGVRVVANKPLAGTHEVQLRAMGVDQAVKARVAWIKKAGFRVYEVGFEFVGQNSTKRIVDWIARWSAQNNP